MAATIQVLPAGSEGMILQDAFAVSLSGWPIMIFSCNHQAVHFARLLNTARESSHRDAMQILTQQCGYCEHHAEQIFRALQSDGNPQLVPDDIATAFSSKRPN